MVSTKPHLNQHDNNQRKYRKDDPKNFLPILFYPFVSGLAFSALSFSSFRSLHVVKKISELAIQSCQYRKKKQLTTTITKKKTYSNNNNREQKLLKHRC